VLNESQCTVTVSVDGWEATSVEANQSRTVDNVGAGRHVLEVKDSAGRPIRTPLRRASPAARTTTGASRLCSPH